jgi:3D (Asp-Asp-Asp) domain-containing protein
MQPESDFSGSASNPTFDLPEPSSLDPSAKRILWATQYLVPAVNAVADGEPLLDDDGEPLGPELSARDWCNAAIEGTVSVRTLDGQNKLYNFAGKGPIPQVNCRDVLGSQHLSQAINFTRFTMANGPFGDGVRGLFLVPFRSIAVDKRQLNGLKFETAVFIPLARGTQITLPSGATAIHDGYFFAADTGGMIKDNHIDVFTGTVTTAHNPFTNFVKSNPHKTFDAFLINDPAITAALKKMHTTR